MIVRGNPQEAKPRAHCSRRVTKVGRTVSVCFYGISGFCHQYLLIVWSNVQGWLSVTVAKMACPSPNALTIFKIHNTMDLFILLHSLRAIKLMDRVHYIKS